MNYCYHNSNSNLFLTCFSTFLFTFASCSKRIKKDIQDKKYSSSSKFSFITSLQHKLTPNAAFYVY